MVQERRTPDQLAPTKPMLPGEPGKGCVFDPIEIGLELLVRADRAEIERWDGTDPYVINTIHPIIQKAFARYTISGDGKSWNGEPVSLERDDFDRIPGKATYLVAQDKGTVLGVLRVIRSWVASSEAAIPAMTLMPGYEWSDPNKTRFGEVDRFALNQDQLTQKQLGVDRGRVIQRKLYEALMELARAEGFADLIYGILGVDQSFIEESRIPIKEVPGACLDKSNPLVYQFASLFPRLYLPILFPAYRNQDERPASYPKLFRYGV